jgi:Ca2+-binding EF-hand superfamily protein
MEKADLEVVLKSIGVKYSKTLYDKLFWLFDMNNDGKIDLREYTLISNLFKKNTVEERCKLFFDICDQECEGFIDETKLWSTFKKFFDVSQKKSKDVKAHIEKLVRDFIDLVRPLKKSEILREEVLRSAKISPMVRQVIDEAVAKSDLADCQRKVGGGSSFLQGQNIMSNSGGIHYAHFNSFIKAIEEKQKIYHKGVNDLKRVKKLEELLQGDSHQEK